MEPGEKEMREVFESTTMRNVQAAITHGNETRKIVRNLEEKIQALQNVVLSRENELVELRKQLVNIQAELYSGGTS